MMKRTCLIICNLLLLGVWNLTVAQDMGRSVSLFSDIKANRVGKGITVLVMEFSQATNEAKTETKKQSNNSISGQAGTGLLGFLPEMGVDTKSQNDYRGNARTSRKGELRAKVAARIVGVNDAGDYIIEGKRVIEVNEEKEIYILRGAVRSEDIMADNTVYSYNIYDAHIIYKGRGEVSRSQKGGFLTRLLQWIF